MHYFALVRSDYRHNFFEYFGFVQARYDKLYEQIFCLKTIDKIFKKIK